MKATLNEGFADAVAWVARCAAAAGKVFNPTLSGLYLRAEGETLTLSATDADAWAQAEIPATVHDPGEALLSAHLLAQVAATLPGADAGLAVDEAGAVLSCGALRVECRTMEVGDYPEPAPTPPALGELDGAELRRALARVDPARATGAGAMPALEAVTVLPGETTLRLVASDRYRLAAASVAWDPTGTPVGEILAPARVLAVPEGVGRVTLHAAPGDRVGLSWPGHRMSTPVVSGQPIPADKFLVQHAASGPGADVARAGLAAMLARVAPVAPAGKSGGGGYAGLVLISAEPGMLRADASGEAGRIRDEMEAEYDGEPLAFHMNAAYLKDAAKAAGGEQIKITPGLRDDGQVRSLVVASVGDESYTHIVMVVRAR